MWEWFSGISEGYGDYTEFIVTSAGEVYDSTTGEITGWYDEATDTIYNVAGEVVTQVQSAGIVVYEDLKEGLESVGGLAGKAIDAADTGLGAVDKALNIASVFVIGGLALGAYWYFFGGKTVLMKAIK